MRHASYTLTRIFGPLWRWDADHHGEHTAHGHRLGKGRARWAARTWLRNRQAAASAAGPAGGGAGRIAAE